MVEAGDGLQVMADDVGPRRDNGGDAFPIPPEVGDQEFDPGFRGLRADRSDRSGIEEGAAVAEVVAGRAGYYHMGKPQTGDRLRYPRRFIGINRERRLLCHVTEGAEA